MPCWYRSFYSRNTKKISKKEQNQINAIIRDIMKLLDERK